MNDLIPEEQSAPLSHSLDELSLSLVTQAIRGLTAELPLNDFGLPTGIYRTDLLPMHEYIAPGSNGHSFGSAGVDNTADVLADGALNSGGVDLVQAVTVPSDKDSPQDLIDDTSDETFDEAPADPFLDIAADPFALMAGEGDGLPDLLPTTTTIECTPKSLPVEGPYRIAGFLAKSLSQAFVPLQYDEGFPAFDNGSAFWDKLSYEPMDAFMAFERYLQMSFGGSVTETDAPSAKGIRTLSTLVFMMHPEATDRDLLLLITKYQEYYHLYYWGLRAKAYDLFRVTQYRQQQEIRALETQDDHYVQSRKLRMRLSEYMDSEEDFWDLMTPKVAIDMLKQLTSTERISTGLPSAGPAAADERGGQTFEVAFRTTAQKQAGESLRGDVLSEDGEVLDRALEDPAATQILQELIIKSGG